MSSIERIIMNYEWHINHVYVRLAWIRKKGKFLKDRTILNHKIKHLMVWFNQLTNSSGLTKCWFIWIILLYDTS